MLRRTRKRSVADPGSTHKPGRSRKRDGDGATRGGRTRPGHRGPAFAQAGGAVPERWSAARLTGRPDRRSQAADSSDDLMSMTAILPRSSLVDAAAEALRSAIREGRWRVGERIPVEPRLAEMLGVGRSTVREAVRILASAGVLEVRQGAGTFVRTAADPLAGIERLRRSGLRDQFEVRCALEAEAARLAARRAGPDDIAALHALLDARGEWTGEPADRAGFVARDYAFHRALVAASGNASLVNLYAVFADAVTGTIASCFSPEIPDPGIPAHRAVVDAVAAGDGDAAAAAVRAFMAPMIARLEELIRA
jgi:DNA-binding FadR family transcriptional regulator